MGVIACVLFGIIAAWISRSMQQKNGKAGLLSIMIVGLVGGLLGLCGTLAGFGDLENFNLYNVFFSIGAAFILMIGWNKILHLSLNQHDANTVENR